MSDPIADAIAATANPKLVAKGKLTVKVMSGKEIYLEFPTDLSPKDLVDLVGYLTVELPKHLAQAGKQQIHVVPAMPPGLKT